MKNSNPICPQCYIYPCLNKSSRDKSEWGEYMCMKRGICFLCLHLLLPVPITHQKKEIECYFYPLCFHDAFHDRDRSILYIYDYNCCYLWSTSLPPTHFVPCLVTASQCVFLSCHALILVRSGWFFKFYFSSIIEDCKIVDFTTQLNSLFLHTRRDTVITGYIVYIHILCIRWITSNCLLRYLHEYWF